MSGYFNIRVYGIAINRKQQLLLSNESYKGRSFTKFPGGGLEQGEGTHDCLKREFQEEYGAEIEILEHFYTTDFYQSSVFNASEQVISIYYMIRIDESIKTNSNGLFWKLISELNSNDVTFPIDKVVVEKILLAGNP